jgi:hypothetical protein
MGEKAKPAPYGGNHARGAKNLLMGATDYR